MATTETQRASVEEVIPFFDVALEIFVTTEITRQDLEALAVDVLECVEAHASHLASEPIMSVRFAPPVIELGLDIPATTVSEMHQRIGDLLEVLADKTALKAVSSATRAQPPKRELVCA